MLKMNSPLQAAKRAELGKGKQFRSFSVLTTSKGFERFAPKRNRVLCAARFEIPEGNLKSDFLTMH